MQEFGFTLFECRAIQVTCDWRNGAKSRKPNLG